MSRLRDAVDDQLGLGRPSPPAVDPSTLVRFAADLPAELTSEEHDRLATTARELDPRLQGPFLLGGDLVVGGAWRTDLRWSGLSNHVPEDLSGQHVLDVGSNAGYDAFMFNRRGAEHVLACEPFDFIRQARFLEELYRTGVEFQQLGWQALDPAVQGKFSLVHCHGVLYHEMHPVALLQRLREMVAPGGTLLLGSMMLADPELAEYARFVPTSYYDDPTWWWVPGRLAMRWMLEAVGFDIREEFGLANGPPGQFATVNSYFRCELADPASATTHVDPKSGKGV